MQTEEQQSQLPSPLNLVLDSMPGEMRTSKAIMHASLTFASLLLPAQASAAHNKTRDAILSQTVQTFQQLLLEKDSRLREVQQKLVLLQFKQAAWSVGKQRPVRPAQDSELVQAIVGTLAAMHSPEQRDFDFDDALERIHVCVRAIGGLDDEQQWARVRKPLADTLTSMHRERERTFVKIDVAVSTDCCQSDNAAHCPCSCCQQNLSAALQSSSVHLNILPTQADFTSSQNASRLQAGVSDTKANALDQSDGFAGNSYSLVETNGQLLTSTRRPTSLASAQSRRFQIVAVDKAVQCDSGAAFAHAYQWLPHDSPPNKTDSRTRRECLQKSTQTSDGVNEQNSKRVTSTDASTNTIRQMQFERSTQTKIQDVRSAKVTMKNEWMMTEDEDNAKQNELDAERRALQEQVEQLSQRNALLEAQWDQFNALLQSQSSAASEQQLLCSADELPEQGYEKDNDSESQLAECRIQLADQSKLAQELDLKNQALRLILDDSQARLDRLLNELERQRLGATDHQSLAFTRSVSQLPSENRLRIDFERLELHLQFCLESGVRDRKQLHKTQVENHELQLLNRQLKKELALLDAECSAQKNEISSLKDTVIGAYSQMENCRRQCSELRKKALSYKQRLSDSVGKFETLKRSLKVPLSKSLEANNEVCYFSEPECELQRNKRGNKRFVELYEKARVLAGGSPMAASGKSCANSRSVLTLSITAPSNAEWI